MSAPVALVTGGGSGIGLAVASHLLNHHGYRVAILDIDRERITRESQQLHPQNCLGIHADVTNYQQLSQAFQQTFEWGGNRLDVVFLNAGIGDSDSLYKDTNIDETTTLPAPLDVSTLKINLESVIQGVHLAGHFFSVKNNTPGGKIITTSSVLGLYPLHPLPLYAASKHGLVGLIRSLAPIYLKDKITINALCPALIYTNLMPRHIASEFHIPSQTTPMSTALKAFDAILADDELTGQTMELTLDEVVFKQRPEYSRPNVEWLLTETVMWERVCEPGMPRAAGENAVVVKVPAKEAI